MLTYLEKLLSGIAEVEVVVAFIGVASTSCQMWRTVCDEDKMPFRL
jgi:predicted secreted protein